MWQISEIYFPMFFLQVFLEPFQIIVHHAVTNAEVHRPHCEHQASVKARVVVFVRHVHAGGAKTRDVHEPVISEDVVLACQDVGFG